VEGSCRQSLHAPSAKDIFRKVDYVSALTNALSSTSANMNGLFMDTGIVSGA